MRGRIVSASVGLSLALHGAIAVRLAWTRPPAPSALDLAHSVEVTTVVVQPRSSVVAVSAPARAAPTRLRNAASRAPRASAPPSEATQKSGATMEPRSGPVDLFAADALNHAITAAPMDPGGHLRRADDPAPAGPTERDIVGGRVHDMLADAAARERASSGHVAPRWREIERTLAQTFRPPLAVVKQENVAKALAHQILRSWLDGEPRTGTVARGVDASVQNMVGTPPGMNLRSLPGEQALALQARWGEPARSLRVEVEVIIDEEGRIMSARVTQPSGRRLFDRTALAAVEDAIRAGGAPEERRTVATRWVVDAAVAVSPPTAIGFQFDETGHLNSGATGWRKYVAPTYPLQQSVRSHVALVAIEPR